MVMFGLKKMTFVLALISFYVFGLKVFSQSDFYDDSKIQEIKITFNYTN